MNTPPGTNEIAHVVFTDYVGYSTLSMEEKRRLDHELTEAVRECPAVLGGNEERRIVRDTGDGVSLIFFADPLPAAEAAAYLHERINARAKTKLRIGCHSGPVVRRLDANGDWNVTGAGIEKAQRVMTCADGARVLCSEFFVENISSFEAWRDRLTPIGEREVKHGEKLRIWYMNDGEAVKKASGKVALLYKRKAQPDEGLLVKLEKVLGEKGFDVFIDRHLSIGLAWAQEIEKQIRGADAVVALISEKALESEMLLAELEIATQEMQERGKPIILPVRVAYDGPIEGDVARLLNRYQYVLWTGHKDDETVAESIANAILNPPSAEIKPVGALEPAGGAVPLVSPFYIVRDTDDEFVRAVASHDSIVLVRGARQMGKTSLLARALGKAQDSGSKVVLTDFQAFSTSELESDQRLYMALAYEISSQLGLEPDIEKHWNSFLGANSNLEKYIQNRVLGQIEGHLIWAMDEVDRLFTQKYAGDFFGLVRSWHNRRALRTDGPWSRLTIAIAYATEAHLFITDLNQSPFNVGTRITLSDFSPAQVAELNIRYGSPLSSSEVVRFHELTGGHPYLCRRGLDEIVRRSLPLSEFERLASEEEGPYGDHLRRILVGLSSDQVLRQEIGLVLRQNGTPTSEAFFRLRTAGLLSGDTPSSAKMRSRVYHDFLLRHLA